MIEQAANASESAAEADEGQDEALGRRLRELRKLRLLSIQALALRSGLSTGMLSLIERGRATPSIRSLRTLGNALGVPIAWFFTSPETDDPEPSPYIVRKSRRGLLRLTSTHVRKQLLTPGSPGSTEIYEIALEAGGSSGPEFASQAGEKAGIVISAQFRLWLKERPHILTEGDSFRFPASIPHRFDNPGAEPTRVYWIVNTQGALP